MDVPKLLEAASLLVPEAVATENDITVNDVWEYLAHDEWEVALNLLEELGDVHPLPLAFWQTLATAAEQMRLDRSAAWCHWRCFETRNGIIRADLTLRPAHEARLANTLLWSRRPTTDVEHRRKDPDRRTRPLHSRPLGGVHALHEARRARPRRVSPLSPLEVATASARSSDHHARGPDCRWNSGRPGDPRPVSPACRIAVVVDGIAPNCRHFSSTSLDHLINNCLPNPSTSAVPRDRRSQSARWSSSYGAGWCGS